MTISAKFGPNLFSGFREEDENMKSLQAEIVIGRSSTRFVILVQIGNPTRLPGPIICSDSLKI
jgi:hypothetical protein